jgi:hypothetical protein
MAVVTVLVVTTVTMVNSGVVVTVMSCESTDVAVITINGNSGTCGGGESGNSCDSGARLYHCHRATVRIITSAPRLPLSLSPSPTWLPLSHHHATTVTSVDVTTVTNIATQYHHCHDCPCHHCYQCHLSPLSPRSPSTAVKLSPLHTSLLPLSPHCHHCTHHHTPLHRPLHCHCQDCH